MHASKAMTLRLVVHFDAESVEHFMQHHGIEIHLTATLIGIASIDHWIVLKILVENKLMMYIVFFMGDRDIPPLPR
jgi:hypothetical protein